MHKKTAQATYRWSEHRKRPYDLRMGNSSNPHTDNLSPPIELQSGVIKLIYRLNTMSNASKDAKTHISRHPPGKKTLVSKYPTPYNIIFHIPHQTRKHSTLLGVQGSLPVTSQWRRVLYFALNVLIKSELIGTIHAVQVKRKCNLTSHVISSGRLLGTRSGRGKRVREKKKRYHDCDRKVHSYVIFGRLANSNTMEGTRHKEYTLIQNSIRLNRV